VGHGSCPQEQLPSVLTVGDLESSLEIGVRQMARARVVMACEVKLASETIQLGEIEALA
jgi:hypothetical protein